MSLYVKASVIPLKLLVKLFLSFLAYKDESTSFVLGLNSLVTWSISVDGKITLIYSTLDRQTIVNLVCSQELDQLSIGGEYEHNHYNLTLSSKCACWNEC
jgi:hypothetical protein